MATRDELLQWSFISCLVGGILILVGGIAAAAMMSFFGLATGGMPHMGADGMDGGAPFAFFAWMGIWMALWGVVLGILVLVAAARIRSATKPTAWGIVALVAGALSFVGMAGFFLGSLAAIVGGVLAIVADQQPAPVA